MLFRSVVCLRLLLPPSSPKPRDISKPFSKQNSPLSPAPRSSSRPQHHAHRHLVIPTPRTRTQNSPWRRRSGRPASSPAWPRTTSSSLNSSPCARLYSASAAAPIPISLQTSSARWSPRGAASLACSGRRCPPAPPPPTSPGSPRLSSLPSLPLPTPSRSASRLSFSFFSSPSLMTLPPASMLGERS